MTEINKKVEKENWLAVATLLARYLNPLTVFKNFQIRTNNGSQSPASKVRTG